MFSRRFFVLLGILLVLGFATGALAAESTGPVDRLSPEVTRAEALALLLSSDTASRDRVRALQSRMPPLGLFKDVDQTAWYAPYIEVAFEQGVIQGNPDRTFRPAQMLRVEEAMALVTRFRQRGQETPFILYIPGAQRGWFTGTLQAAVAQGVRLPDPLYLGLPITRNDFYAMLTSIGIQNPAQIAFVEPPAPPVPVAAPTRAVALQPIQRGVTTRPTTTATTNRPRTTATTPTAPAVPSPRTFSITLPSLGINNLTITHPQDPFSSNGLLAPLKYGVGHLFSYPGTNGKILIYGHSSSYPWDVSAYTKIFRQINKLNPGDKVYVSYEGTTHVYEVSYKEAVPAKDMSAYRNGGSEELILYTCWPPDSIAQRYLVHAKPVEKIAAR